jgi:hypothetical protein
LNDINPKNLTCYVEHRSSIEISKGIDVPYLPVMPLKSIRAAEATA